MVFIWKKFIVFNQYLLIFKFTIMKKLGVILSLVIASFLFFGTSCGTSSSSSPSDLSIKLIKDMEKGNVDAIIDVFSTQGKALTDEDIAKLNALILMGQEELKKKDGIKSSKVIEEDINEAGDKATVKIEIVYGDGSEDTQTYKFVMEDGKWKYSLK